MADPTVDPFVHHALLYQICELTGSDLEVSVDFGLISCPKCTERLPVFEAAMAQIVDEHVIDMLRWITSLPADDPRRNHARKLLQDAGHIRPD